MCQLDTVRLPPDNVHVGEKRKRVGGVSDGEQEMRRTEGFATEIAQITKRWASLLLKPPFSHLEV